MEIKKRVKPCKLFWYSKSQFDLTQVWSLCTTLVYSPDNEYWSMVENISVKSRFKKYHWIHISEAHQRFLSIFIKQEGGLPQ